jgi:DNA-binding CsgD family transcriptional regulator
LGHVLTWLGDTDRARTWLEARLAEWTERDERARGEYLWYLAVVETLAGRWVTAQEYADRSAEIFADYGTQRPWDFPAALLALYRGDLQAARSLSERGLTLGGDEPVLHMYLGTLGTCDLWSGDPQGAIARFAQAEASAAALGMREPVGWEWRPDYVEALLQLGRIDEADSLTSAWDVSARRLKRHRVVAQVVRCRGLIASARGNVEAAVKLLEEAIVLHERTRDPFGRARAYLALGVNLRRLRQKRSARDAIETALATFQALGAGHWIAAARAELGRIGGRTRLSGLSTSERSVASLAAEGRTNREIASRLFLGERTVASHLTHIYAKLGVRSRTELARHLTTTADAGAASLSPGGSASNVPTS